MQTLKNTMETLQPEKRVFFNAEGNGGTESATKLYKKYVAWFEKKGKGKLLSFKDWLVWAKQKGYVSADGGIDSKKLSADAGSTDTSTGTSSTTTKTATDTTAKAPTKKDSTPAPKGIMGMMNKKVMIGIGIAVVAVFFIYKASKKKA